MFGELVYVNYGRVEDIEELHQLGVNLTGILYSIHTFVAELRIYVMLYGFGSEHTFAILWIRSGDAVAKIL